MIFIDASVFYGYMNIDDVHHKMAKHIMEKIAAKIYWPAITTDYVFDETTTVTSRKLNRAAAIELGRFIEGSEILLSKVGEAAFQKAWKIFQQSEGLSFTDCTIIAFMQINGITDLATFDRGFDLINGINIIHD